MKESSYIAIGLGISVLLYTMLSHTPTTNDKSVIEVQEPTLDTTAVNIQKAYDRNEIAADREYTGRKIRVAGIVAKISSAHNNTAQVSLETDNMFKSVITSGDREFDAKAAQLRKGQQIRITCIGAGEVIGSPVLNNCVIP